jgi:hypothetical protein
LVKAPTAVDDFYSTEEIKRIYYPEVDLGENLGASRVFVFNHNVGNAGRPGASTPVRRVHNDHTVLRRRRGCAIISAPTRRNFCGTASASMLVGGRGGIHASPVIGNVRKFDFLGARRHAVA